MCVGALVANEPQLKVLRKKTNALKFRQKLGKKDGSSEVRKEKSRDAARCRRAKESDYFQDLEDLLPVSGNPPRSMSSIDKTSLIRLTVSHLKCRDVVAHGGLRISPTVKEELGLDINVVDVLDGFSLVLSQEGDVIHVSNNVTNVIGLSSFELLGNSFSEFIHPCDHEQLKKLHPQGAEQDSHVEVFVRMKCTITDRGRMINLKQANYKALKLSGKARRMEERESGGGVTGVIFLGIGSLVYNHLDNENTSWAFATKHAADMKFTEVEGWLTEEGNYAASQLLGKSFFELVHAQDIHNVIPAFKNLKEHGQCETLPFRLLVGGGGSVWVQTKATQVTARRGSNKGKSICCKHTVITEIENRYEILSVIQTQAMRRGRSFSAGSSSSFKRRPKVRNSSSVSGGETSRLGSVGATATSMIENHHRHAIQSEHQSHSQTFAAAVAASSNTMPPPTTTRFREMDLLLDMLAMDQQQQQTSLKEQLQTALELQQTRLESNSSTAGFGAAAITTTKMVATGEKTDVLQDAYSDLLVTSPSNSVEEETSGYISETLAIHLAPMPSVAIKTAHQAAREAAAHSVKQQQEQTQHVILQQRPTSVIVASSSLGGPSLTSGDFGGIGVQTAKPPVPPVRRDFFNKVSAADEAEGVPVLGLVSLPVFDSDNNCDCGPKSDLYLGGSSSKKLAGTHLMSPTSNLFSRPKAVTDSLFSFSSNSTTASATSASLVVEPTGMHSGDNPIVGTDNLMVGSPPGIPVSLAPVVIKPQQQLVRAAESADPATTTCRSSFGAGSFAKEFSMEEDTLLRELFGDMADSGTELEKLSPYIGDVCVILKEPGNNSCGVKNAANSRDCVPLSYNTAAASSSNVMPIDVQVIDFGPAGAGFDDYEIPLLGGEYKVKSEPGLEVDLNDFSELLAPLSPSQETPLLLQEEEVVTTNGLDDLMRRRMPAVVKCEMERGLQETTGANLFMVPMQAHQADPVRKSVISRHPGLMMMRSTTSVSGSSGGEVMVPPYTSFSGGDTNPTTHLRSSVLRGTSFAGSGSSSSGGYDFMPIVIPGSPPPAQQDFFFSLGEDPMYRGIDGDYTEVLYSSLSDIQEAGRGQKRSRHDLSLAPVKDIKRFKPVEPPLSMS